MARRHRGKRRGGNRYLQQARLEAKVRYSPERSALRELLREAASDLATNIGAEEGAARGIRAASHAAKPEISRIYQNAGRSYGEADQDVGKALGGLSAAADPYRAISTRESGGARRRLAESMAGAERELTERSVQAEHGRQFGVRQALSRYGEDVQKVRGRQQALAGEIGAFKLATMKDLREADAKAGDAERKFQLSLGREERQARKDEAGITGIDPATGKPTATERARRQKSKPGGGGRKTGLTPSKRLSYREDLRHIADTAGRYKDKGFKWNFNNAREKYDPILAKAGVERGVYGGVNPKLARQLRRDYGISVRVRRPKKKSRRRSLLGVPGAYPGL